MHPWQGMTLSPLPCQWLRQRSSQRELLWVQVPLVVMVLSTLKYEIIVNVMKAFIHEYTSEYQD